MAGSAIVTGGASGIGLALARVLVRRGLRVVIADIDGPAASAAARLLETEAAGPVRAEQVDVADADAVTALVTGTHARDGRLDYLFNNAGIGAIAPIELMDLDHWRRTLDVNLGGVIHGCHAAYPLMAQQGFGRIVNTASLAGLLGGFASGAPYATSKHAVVGLSLALRVAAAPHGVSVHVVCPGGIDTPLLDKHTFPGLPLPEEAGARSMRALSADMGVRRFYSADRFAGDVLRGVDRGRALIVGPSSARLIWRLWRLAPEVMLRALTAATQRQATKA